MPYHKRDYSNRYPDYTFDYETVLEAEEDRCHLCRTRLVKEEVAKATGYCHKCQETKARSDLMKEAVRLGKERRKKARSAQK